eukprot:Pgem_evm1s2909
MKGIIQTGVDYPVTTSTWGNVDHLRKNRKITTNEPKKVPPSLNFNGHLVANISAFFRFRLNAKIGIQVGPSFPIFSGELGIEIESGVKLLAYAKSSMAAGAAIVKDEKEKMGVGVTTYANATASSKLSIMLYTGIYLYTKGVLFLDELEFKLPISEAYTPLVELSADSEAIEPPIELKKRINSNTFGSEIQMGRATLPPNKRPRLRYRRDNLNKLKDVLDIQCPDPEPEPEPLPDGDNEPEPEPEPEPDTQPDTEPDTPKSWGSWVKEKVGFGDGHSDKSWGEWAKEMVGFGGVDSHKTWGEWVKGDDKSWGEWAKEKTWGGVKGGLDHVLSKIFPASNSNPRVSVPQYK